MSTFSLDNQVGATLNTPEMKQYLPFFVPPQILSSIPEKYYGNTFRELKSLLSMPWGGPFIPEIFLDGAERVREMIEENRFEYLALWKNESTFSMPKAMGNDRDSVYLMRLKEETKKNSGKKRPAAIICPGGGYALLSMQNEGIDFAERMEAAGYASFVLYYRVSPNRYPEPQKDLALAIKFLRANAEEFSIDPERILIMGASAAGHLCASETAFCRELEESLMKDLERDVPSLAARTKGISAKADMEVLVYPVIDFTEFPHEDSFQELTGGEESLREKLSIQKHVDQDFPKCFIWANKDDELVPYQNSVCMAEALEKAGASVKLKLYPEGGHGCGVAKGLPAAGWMDEMLDFLGRG